MQDKYEARHIAAGIPPNHGMFKLARAGVAAMFAMFHPDKPPLADWVHIKNIAQDLRATAPNLPKYSETISLDPFFATLVAAYKQGLRFEHVSMKILRNWCLVLVRIRLMCRSADVACINHIYTDDPDQSAVACLAHGATPGSVDKVRFDFPKSFRHRARASAWKHLGAYLCDSPGFREEFSLCCAKQALEIYLRRTADLPWSPFVDPKRPTEQLRRVFISLSKKRGKYHPIRPATVGSSIKGILKDLGFDVSKFQGHILRSASLRATIDATHDPVRALNTASVSEKVFSIFYDLPKQAASATPAVPGSLEDARAAATLVLAATLPTAPGDAAPSNHDESSGVFTRRSLVDRDGSL